MDITLKERAIELGISELNILPKNYKGILYHDDSFENKPKKNKELVTWEIYLV